MELIEKLKKSSVATSLSRFPNTHLAAAGVLSVSLLVVSALSGEKTQASARHVLQLTLPSVSADTNGSATAIPVPTEKAASSQASLHSKEIKIESGDTLGSLFKRAGLNDRVMMNFLAAADEKDKLNNLRSGHRVIFSLNGDNELEELTYIVSKLSSFSFFSQSGLFSKDHSSILKGGGKDLLHLFAFY